MARARITSKFQITVPKEIRRRLGVGLGDSLEFIFEDDRLEVRPVRRQSIREFRGIFEGKPPLSFEEEREQAWMARARELMDESDG